MNQFKCKCGRCYNITLASNRAPVDNTTWTAQARAFAMRGQDADSLQVVPQPPRPFVGAQPGAYIETPVAQQSLENNVKVPLAQSLITGGFVGCITTCASVYFGLPKPVLLVTVSTLVSSFIRWNGAVPFAGSLLTRVEDYTGLDLNQDGQVGSQPQPSPVLHLVKVKSGYDATANNQPVYQPTPTEIFINIPGMPRSKPDEDPWTVERLTDVLERAFISGRWGRAHHKELGMSQGQWSALSKYLGSGDDGEGYNVWGATDRPTLDGFVEQISTPVPHPTGLSNH